MTKYLNTYRPKGTITVQRTARSERIRAEKCNATERSLQQKFINHILMFISDGRLDRQ